MLRNHTHDGDDNLHIMLISETRFTNRQIIHILKYKLYDRLKYIHPYAKAQRGTVVIIFYIARVKCCKDFIGYKHNN